MADTVSFEDGAVVVDAAVLAEGLGIDAAEVPELLRAGAITSVTERGVEEDTGRWRLTFFHQNRRLRLIVDDTGRIVRRSSIDFGGRGPPAGRGDRARLKRED